MDTAPLTAGGTLLYFMSGTRRLSVKVADICRRPTE